MPQEHTFKEQIIDLQSQLAFQEDTIHTLNHIVTEQQQQIERLNEMINQIKSQLEVNNDNQSGESLAEKPPHY
ncbi:MAG: SlyX protein [Pseudohongiellaceae bacterium]|jgi:SlyX protein